MDHSKQFYAVCCVILLVASTCISSPFDCLCRLNAKEKEEEEDILIILANDFIGAQFDKTMATCCQVLFVVN